MILEDLRAQVCQCNMELPRNGLVKMTSGNVSGRDPSSGLVVIKPSGLRFEELTPDDMVVVDLDGTVLEGLWKPSVDTATHLYIYRYRSDILGISHTHSPYATSFAVLGASIPACLTASAMVGGEVPIGGYVPIGGEAIGEEIVRKIGVAYAILMQNHGVFTIAPSPWQAMKLAVEVEEIAKITHLAMLRGKPICLLPDQILETTDLYTHRYGQ
jgi:L-ribulose-5-phosphate 4-epimerase